MKMGFSMSVLLRKPLVDDSTEAFFQFKHGKTIAGINRRGVLGAFGSNYEPTQRVCYWWLRLGCGKNGEI